jgi:hypothetical protein
MLNIVGFISIALFFLLPLVIVALVILALVSGFAFGGARRNALALLASGVFSLLTGAGYLYGVSASYYAKQDNAYLGNLYVGLFLLLAGAWLLCVGLAGAGLAKWFAAVLALAGVVGIAPIYGALSLNSTSGGAGVALYALAALLAGAATLLALRRGALLGRALGLGLAGAVAALAVYALAGALSGASIAAYLQLGVDQARDHKPPALEGFGLLACVLAGVVVYLLGRRGGGQEAPIIRGPLAPTPERAAAS